MLVGHEFVCEPLPRIGVVVLFGVIKVLAAGAYDHVDDAVGRCVGAAIEFLVERPAAVHNPASRGFHIAPADELGALLVGHKPQGIGALIIVHMAVKDDIEPR
jgi:hypothetical protein